MDYGLKGCQSCGIKAGGDQDALAPQPLPTQWEKGGCCVVPGVLQIMPEAAQSGACPVKSTSSSSSEPALSHRTY